MKTKALHLALAAAMASLAGASFGQAKPAKLSGDTVKIGVLTDMSGVYSDLGGQGSVTAAQMAIDDFKAQAKPAFKIELVYADHQNKADVGSNKAREWYDTQGVDMITDVLNSAVALAVSKVTQEKNRILIDTGAETRREGLWFGREQPAAHPVEVAALCTGPWLTRSYRVVAGGRPLMQITERFPP